MSNSDHNVIGYFGYIDLIGDYYYIKGMDSPDIISALLSAQSGDILKIKNLGALKLLRVHRQNHMDSERNVLQEIGLICNRLDV